MRVRQVGVYNVKTYAEADDLPPSPIAQSLVRHEPLATAKGEKSHTGRVPVRVISYRRRLLDLDNATPKYFVDCCRYAGLIRQDTPDAIDYQISQVKVKKKEDERTEIIIG